MNDIYHPQYGYVRISAEFLREIEPILEKYFGISLPYFQTEFFISNRGLLGSKSQLARCEGTIHFPLTRLDYHQYYKELQPFKLRGIIVDILFLVAYIVKDRKFIYDLDDLDFSDIWYDVYRPDWLRMSVFIDDVLRYWEERGKSGNTSITIHANNSAHESLVIKNVDNWVLRLIRKEFSRYFKITEEQAQREVLMQKRLNRIKKSRSELERDKQEQLTYKTVIYGIYRMFHEENIISDIPDIPNDLCELIYRFTQITGCYPEIKTKDDDFNPKRIRADIHHIKKKVEKFGANHIPKYEHLQYVGDPILEDPKHPTRPLYLDQADEDEYDRVIQEYLDNEYEEQLREYQETLMK